MTADSAEKVPEAAQPLPGFSKHALVPRRRIPLPLDRNGRQRISQLCQNCRHKPQIRIVQLGGNGHRQGVDRSSEGQGITAAVFHSITRNSICGNGPDGVRKAIPRLYSFFSLMGNTVSLSFPSHTAKKTSRSF